MGDEEVPRNEILVGHATEKLKELPDNSVDSVMTSPPYWGLRQYLFDGAVVIDPTLPKEKKEEIKKKLEEKGIEPEIGEEE